MRSLVPLVSPSLEKYPLPTHKCSSFISNKLRSFPLFELFVKIVGSLVSNRIFGVDLQLGLLHFCLAFVMKSCYENIDLVFYPTKTH
jgi:hypothetical protein